MPQVRINRAIAMSGAASRRGAEELILAGRVRLNGKVVNDLATTLDPARDRLELDGNPLRLSAPCYYVYYKPRGQVCTMDDERGRDCTGAICAGLPGKPRPVGRLDRQSEGLLLLTNDGTLANKLMHPRYGVVKEYQVTVEPRLTDRHARLLTEGVDIAPLPGEREAPGRFSGMELAGLDPPRKGDPGRTRVVVHVTEGRYRFIRRMFETLGYSVLLLRRIRLGPLRIGALTPGAHRSVSGDELMQLRNLLGLAGEKFRAPRRAGAEKQKGVDNRGRSKAGAGAAAGRGAASKHPGRPTKRA
jgi:23S rRNA pseudouridine2605 synthase